MRRATRAWTAAAVMVVTAMVAESGVIARRAQNQPASSSPAPARGIARQIEAELAVEPRAAAPGAAIKLLYLVSSYEPEDARVRLRIEAGAAWNVLDAGITGRELFLEKWENLEGELYLLVPENARLGDRQVIRLVVEVDGETGVLHAEASVSVARRGGVKPGVPTISTTTTVGLSRLGAAGLDHTQKARSVAMSTKFGRGSAFSVFYDHGLRENLSNFRFEEQRTRFSGNVRHAGWDVVFGNYVSSPAHTLTGPFVLGRGLTVTRPAGRLIVELAAAQPNAIGGNAGGRLIRGRIGARTSRSSWSLAASDFTRPVGGYTTLSSVQQTLLDADAEERRDLERRLTTSGDSNRVTGVGIEAELRPSPPHRISVRGGGLWLSNAAGAHSAGTTADASYTFTAEPIAATLRWRSMPPTVHGVSIFGKELAADGSLRLRGGVRLVGYVYDTRSETLPDDLSSRGTGSSVGVRFGAERRRVEIRGNVRATEFTVRNVRQTMSLAFGTPIGHSLSMSAIADVGRQKGGWHDGEIVFYRGEARWTRAGSTTTLTISHSEGAGPRRQRVDLLTTVGVRSIDLAGGTWATRGYASGGAPGAWMTVSFPVGGGRFVSVGVDHSPLTPDGASSLRGMINVRQAFSLRLPFASADPFVRNE